MGQIAKNKYGLYWVPDGVERRPAAKKVLSGSVYEPDTIEFIRGHADTGDVIHAGTFFGDFIPAISSSLESGAKLWAFEPNPNSFEAAKKTIELNKTENVLLTNAAVSSRSGKIRFKTKDQNGVSLGGLSHFVEEDGVGVESVSSVMLDFAVPLEREISILQLDVEGHETQAMKGAYHIINLWQPILILEYFNRPKWLQRTFRGLGYREIGKLHHNSVFATDRRAGSISLASAS